LHFTPPLADDDAGATNGNPAAVVAAVAPQ
jgi:hypothetical protein